MRRRQRKQHMEEGSTEPPQTLGSLSQNITIYEHYHIYISTLAYCVQRIMYYIPYINYAVYKVATGSETSPVLQLVKKRVLLPVNKQVYRYEPPLARSRCTRANRRTKSLKDGKLSTTMAAVPRACAFSAVSNSWTRHC